MLVNNKNRIVKRMASNVDVSSNTVDISSFLDKFDKNYEFIYDAECDGKYVAGYREALEYGDEYISDPKNQDFFEKLIKARGDYFSSDREVAALAFTLEDFGLV